MYLSKIELRVARYIEKLELIPPGSSIVVACSGGPDSVMLVHLLALLSRRLKIEIALCHFNHLLRGAESDEDAEFVGKLARQLNLNFHGGSGDVAGYADNCRLSLEEAARKMRYGFFEQVLKKTGADRVAIAHHADDNAETMLINLLRGSGSRGLAGIAPIRGPYVRPLLKLRRTVIIEYLESRNLPYRIDSSNNSRSFLRNRLRHDVLPQLTGINPELVESLSRAGEIFREEDSLLDRLAMQALGELGRPVTSGFELERESFCELDPALQRRMFRLVFGLCRGNLRRLSTAHAESFLHIARSNDPGAALDLPGLLRVKCAYNKIIIEKQSKKKQVSYKAQRLEVPGEVEWPPYLIIAEISSCSTTNFPARNSNQAVFPLAVGERGMIIRSVARGERMRPFGGHTKKVSDLYIDAKIKRRQRAHYPVLADEAGILWIPGVARADRFPVKKTDKSCLLLRCLEK
jgi:tRNA(Ile)-lysidine synthase